MKEGVDIKDVLNAYKNDIDNCCCKNVVQSELLRADMNVKDVEEYCTMKSTADFCKNTPMIRGEYQWPSLE